MADEKELFIDEIMGIFKARFGNSAQGCWVYSDDLCPGCQVNNIGDFYIKGERQVSINAYMYRNRGILIAYLLCGHCAMQVIDNSSKENQSIHEKIEKTLGKAYERYLRSMNA